MRRHSRRSDSHLKFIAVLAIAWGAAAPAFAITTAPADLEALERLVGGNAEHCTTDQGFEEAFECGDELFEVVFNAVDGVGANVGDGGRFTRVPRADLAEWALQVPQRPTGPNASSCVACHQGAEFGGAGDGSGPAAVNAIRDPFHTADPGSFIQRNTPHLFGPGALQRLAEEATVELTEQRSAGIRQACASGESVEVALSSKGVDFGFVRVDCDGVFDDAGIQGIDADLVVRPFQWKGSDLTLRAFSRDAENNELGLQAVELVGEGVDGDGDGVVNELSIPDITAMAVYLAAQPRPVTKIELDALRRRLAREGQADEIARLGLPTLSSAEISSIGRGESLFAAIGCEDCHRGSLLIDDPVFSEPSRLDAYRDDPFPAGQPGLERRIEFDLTRDLPDNQFVAGRKRVDLGNFERTVEGQAIVRLYGDLKRHDMGPGLAESIDETGHGASVWMTKELWGVGSTAPYLHDGRATTQFEAILEHGGEAAASRSSFSGLSEQEQADVLRFLDNLVLFLPEEAEEPAASARKTMRGKQRRR